jgi:hypothetical protein
MSRRDDGGYADVCAVAEEGQQGDPSTHIAGMFVQYVRLNVVSEGRI